MANINPGYMGYADIDGNNVRFDSASVVVKQEINAPDLIMGDWDHDAYNYGPITVGGSIGGPVTENFASGGGSIWDWATNRAGTCGTLAEKTVTLYYYCGTGGRNSRRFTGMLVNSLNFSCSAGDVAKFTIDVMGKSAGPWSSYGTGMQDPEKLLTWDKVTLSASGPTLSNALYFSAFDFTIANNCTPQYALSNVESDLFPYEIVPGLRTITGSLSVYNVPTADGADTWDDYQASEIDQLTFNLGSGNLTFNVRCHRVEPASATGPMISTVAFTGVTHQSF